MAFERWDIGGRSGRMGRMGCMGWWGLSIGVEARGGVGWIWYMVFYLSHLEFPFFLFPMEWGIMVDRGLCRIGLAWLGYHHYIFFWLYTFFLWLLILSLGGEYDHGTNLVQRLIDVCVASPGCSLLQAFIAMKTNTLPKHI